MIGPVLFGLIAAIIMICQPAWQLRDDDRLALGFRMARRDILDEDRLGAADVFDRLARHRASAESR